MHSLRVRSTPHKRTSIVPCIYVDFKEDILCINDVRKRRRKMAHLGYGRVSTDGQSLTAQVAELKAAGCTEIFQEKISGAKSHRKQLARLTHRYTHAFVPGLYPGLSDSHPNSKGKSLHHGKISSLPIEEKLPIKEEPTINR